MSKLTVVVVGVKLGAGTSNKSGTPKPYSFASVSYLVPAKGFQNDQHNIQAAGYEVKDIDMANDPQLFAKFQNGCQFGQEVNLIMDANPENPSRNIVVDFSQKPAS